MLAVQIAIEDLRHLARHGEFARVIDGDHGLDDAQAALRASCAVRGKGERILRKAGAAIARPGMQKFRADALVEADAVRDVLDIGADLLAQIGDLVDEGDLGRQKGIGGIFDELGGAPAR